MTDTKIKLQNLFYILILLLLFPALLINLGLIPISADEGTRALVSLEMEISGSMVTPTINGEFYFNKPPLYNWILLGFYKISHSHSEFIIRLPTILSLLLFGLTIFLSFFRKYGVRASFLSALIFITSARILFYDSFQGLIDITFSWIVFLSFMLLFRFYKREQYLRLFLVSYFICAIGFLMKGLPALLFQGITLLVIFIQGKQFKKLFSLSHLSGILLFVLITGSYYYQVFKQNPDFVYFTTLVNESAKRTFVEYGLLKTIIHLFTFPLEQLNHLLPWSVLIIILFSKKVLRKIREDQILKYMGLVFLFNIPVYWISVESYPRYIFSLYPLVLSVCTITFINSGEEIPRQKLFIEKSLGLFLVLLVPLSLLFPVFYEFKTINYPFLLSLAASLLVVSIFTAYYFLKSYRVEIIIVALLIFRIGFNMVALPERHAETRRVLQKEQAIKVAETTRAGSLILYDFAPLSHESSFYISRESGKILPRSFETPLPGNFYIIDEINNVKENEEVMLHFETRWKNSPLRLSVIK